MKTIIVQPTNIQRQLIRILGLLACIGSLARIVHSAGPEISMTEYEVKAMFLLNFTKYVDWPTNAVTESKSPFVIGIFANKKFSDVLKQTAEAKSHTGRKIQITLLEKRFQPEKVQMLFISDAEKKSLGDILGQTKGQPVLTVGESDQFLDQGGVINFVKKEGKVRLEINLDAAREANLQISSKLLSVADSVKGKTK